MRTSPAARRIIGERPDGPGGGRGCCDADVACGADPVLRAAFGGGRGPELAQSHGDASAPTVMEGRVFAAQWGRTDSYRARFCARTTLAGGAVCVPGMAAGCDLGDDAAGFSAAVRRLPARTN